jgi:hypothetical protein
LVLCATQREDGLEGSRILFAAPSAAERGFEAAFVEHLLERDRLNDVGTHR